jgi:hypothetical protein
MQKEGGEGFSPRDCRVGSLFALKILYYTSVWIDLICVKISVVNEVISWCVSFSFFLSFLILHLGHIITII